MTWLALTLIPWLRSLSWRVWTVLAAILVLWWLVHSRNVAKADLAKLEAQRETAVLEQKAAARRIERNHADAAAGARARLVVVRTDAAAASDAAARAFERVRFKPLASSPFADGLAPGSPATCGPCRPSDGAGWVSADVFAVVVQAAGQLAITADKRGIAGQACERASEPLTTKKQP